VRERMRTLTYPGASSRAQSRVLLDLNLDSDERLRRAGFSGVAPRPCYYTCRTDPRRPDARIDANSTPRAIIVILERAA
jgi:hypothetical protein